MFRGGLEDVLDIDAELEQLEQMRAMLRFAPLRPVGDRNDRERQRRVLDHHIDRVRKLRDRVLCEGGVRGSLTDGDCRSTGPQAPPSQSTPDADEPRPDGATTVEGGIVTETGSAAGSAASRRVQGEPMSNHYADWVAWAKRQKVGLLGLGVPRCTCPTCYAADLARRPGGAFPPGGAS